MPNRKAAEDHILSVLDMIDESGTNSQLYRELFAGMSDDDFHLFMADIEHGRKHLVLTAPNFSKVKLSTENNLKVAEAIGHRFFQKLWIGPKGDTPAYLTPVPYLVVDLPLRRQSQLLTKKISIPEHNRSVDILSGQPTGDSKGAKVSFPELQILVSMDLDQSTMELMKYRGGDVKGFRALNAMIDRYGSASQETLSQYTSGVESIKTVKTFLLGMHLRSTL